MKESDYRDLADFGLPFVTPVDPTFAALVADIQSRPQPFGPQPTGDLSTAAVLLNQSGKAIVVLAYVWRIARTDGQTTSSYHSNLGSSMQIDVLTGRTEVARDRFSFILPGSKRLITQEGVFGDNLDVLPPESVPRGGGYVGTGRVGAMSTSGTHDEITAIELQLDVAFFDDGLCVGPDEFGLYQNVTEDLGRQRNTAEEIVAALRQGASAGQVFEILRPLARRPQPDIAASKRAISPGSLLSGFVSMAISHLVNVSGPELLGWFERFVRPRCSGCIGLP
jgi:hypothetical protein